MTDQAQDAGKEEIIDFARAAAAVHGPHGNFPLTEVDDHVVRMSVMTQPYFWHRHPDSDETFIVIEGRLDLETEREHVTLNPGQLYTVPAGLAHITQPAGSRSVNITIERIGMSTERLPGRP